MQKISPFLWFDNNAEDAMNFYMKVFKNSKILQVSRYPEGSPGPVGQVMVASMEIEGQHFMLLNGGPIFKFNESVSFMIHVETQEEYDHYWYALIADGGEESMCGWLKDKFGLSWQVTPNRLNELLGSPDKEQAARVMQAMLQMQRIDIAKLEAAAKG
jgi:predicted 3-demethylubiquinone-9 3-methyltransferase (glyoxalase superfamily)